MSTKAIPPDVKKQVEEMIEQFNRDNFPGKYPRYSVRYKGPNAYIDRADMNDNAFQICRLSYTGQMNQWKFAIYLHSRDRYDPEEWFFPGSGLVDGTIEGALKAGLEAYPLMVKPRFSLPLFFRLLWMAPRFLWIIIKILWGGLVKR